MSRSRVEPDGPWVVTGAGGMLGRDVVAALEGRQVRALGRADLDITDEQSVERAVSGAAVVVNCAGWTAVDLAEEQEPEAFVANAVGPAHLARACRRSGAALVHVSTDYVFDGTASTPYAEDAPLSPRSAYGRTKAAGEWAVRAEAPDRSYVVRTAWLYGRHGGNLPATMLRLLGERDTVEVVDDQRGQPTWTHDLARHLIDLVTSGAPAGTYHGTASGDVTWCGLVRHLLELTGSDPARVHPTTTDRFPRPAPRPAYSVLGHRRWADAGLVPMRAWDEALAEAVSLGVLAGPLPGG